MRTLATIMIVAAALCALAQPAAAQTPDAREAAQISSASYSKAIWNQYHWTNRALRNRCRPTVHHLSGFTKTPLSIVLPGWRDEHVAWAKNRHHRAQARSSLCLSSLNASEAIEHYFGARAPEAHRVASCESGHSIWAVNGQYVGVFQMGSHERATYGWYVAGAPAYVQVRSAYRYFVASGSDWSPWQCKP
jgi:hypothetical protein